jgi:hypothetical protein
MSLPSPRLTTKVPPRVTVEQGRRAGVAHRGLCHTLDLLKTHIEHCLYCLSLLFCVVYHCYSSEALSSATAFNNVLSPPLRRPCAVLRAAPPSGADSVRRELPSSSSFTANCHLRGASPWVAVLAKRCPEPPSSWLRFTPPPPESRRPTYQSPDRVSFTNSAPEPRRYRSTSPPGPPPLRAATVRIGRDQPTPLRAARRHPFHPCSKLRSCQNRHFLRPATGAPDAGALPGCSNSPSSSAPGRWAHSPSAQPAASGETSWRAARLLGVELPPPATQPCRPIPYLLWPYNHMASPRPKAQQAMTGPAVLGLILAFGRPSCQGLWARFQRVGLNFSFPFEFSLNISWETIQTSKLHKKL